MKITTIIRVNRNTFGKHEISILRGINQVLAKSPSFQLIIQNVYNHNYYNVITMGQSGNNHVVQEISDLSYGISIRWKIIPSFKSYSTGLFRERGNCLQYNTNGKMEKIHYT